MQMIYLLIYCAGMSSNWYSMCFVLNIFVMYLIEWDMTVDRFVYVLLVGFES